AEKVNLYVENFSDVREATEPNVIGEGFVGVFNKRTPIATEDGIIEPSTQTLREAFSTAGFNVVMQEEDADLVFKGRINSFWIQEMAVGTLSEHSVAEVEFDVAVVDRFHEKIIWFDVKRSRIKSGRSMDATHLNEETLNQAFNKVVTSILDDHDLRAAISDFVRSKE
ncbi:MAG: YajG family lipoprotein, partial [Nitrososphaerales archaeon]